MNSKSIWGLQNQFGEMIKDDTQLKHLSVSHFTELFSDDGLTTIEDQLKFVRLFLSLVLEEEKNISCHISHFQRLKVFLGDSKRTKVLAEMAVL